MLLPMPHGSIGIAHTILYNWTLRVMTLFKGLCSGLCFTKMDVTLCQIKLVTTIFNLYQAFPRDHRPDIQTLGWSWIPLWDVTPLYL